MLLKNRELELSKGLKVGDGEHMEELIHLVFTYGTLILYNLNEMVMHNLICILLSFQAIFGLKY